MITKKWLLLLLVILTMMSLATYTGVTNSAFLDQEDSSGDALCTITSWYHLAWHWRKPVTISNGGGATSYLSFFFNYLYRFFPAMPGKHPQHFNDTDGNHYGAGYNHR